MLGPTVTALAQTAPATSEVEPPVEQVEPAVEEAEPAVDEATPVTGEATPAVEQPEPSVEPVEPAAGAVTPAADAQASPSGVETGPPEATTSEAPSEALRKAMEAVETGEALFEAGNFDAAVAQFERAYELLGDDPRRHALLNNIAVSHERAFRYAAALRYYHRYLSESAPDAADRAEVGSVIRTLDNLLGTVVLQVSGAPELWVDGRHVGACPSELKLPAGRRVVELRATGFEPQRREITVTARQTTTVRFTLRPISELGGLPPHFFYLGVGLTAAAAATATVLGALLLRNHGRAEDFAARQGNRQTADALSRQEALANLERGTDLALGATAALGTATVVLLLMTNWHLDAPAEAPADAVVTAAAPWVSANAGGVRVMGTFH